MGGINIESGSTLSINSVPPITIQQVSNIAPLHIQEVSHISPLHVDRVQNIAPVAAHIKEINHIDPISIDSLHVSEVKNIEPINIQTFNVTNLPTVNMSLRQLPPVEMSLRRLPPLSVGTHQEFDIPSHYTLRARLFGVEFLRLHLTGHTFITPKERYRREQEKSPERSFPLTATAGNPSIPSRHIEESSEVYYPRALGCGSTTEELPLQHGYGPDAGPCGGLHVEHPGMWPSATYGVGSVKSGG